MLLRLPVFALFWLIISCSSNQERVSKSTDTYTIATPNYAILAEKAISYQADFNPDGLANLLADDIQYFLPDSAQPLIGKQAVLAYWKSYPQRMKLSSWQLSQFDHIPVQSNQQMRISGLKGVHVFSIFRSQFNFLDGRRRNINLNCYSHFNKQSLIDRFYSFHQSVLVNLTTGINNN